MKQLRRLIPLFIALTVPFITSGQTFAASPSDNGSITQEIKVSAVVPHHRDIVIDYAGNIMQVKSNTPQDVTPTVYLGRVAPENQQPLTDELYRQYRQHVPEGTAKAGVLYQRGLPVSILRSGEASPLQLALR